MYILTLHHLPSLPFLPTPLHPSPPLRIFRTDHPRSPPQRDPLTSSGSSNGSPTLSYLRSAHSCWLPFSTTSARKYWTITTEQQLSRNEHRLGRRFSAHTMSPTPHQQPTKFFFQATISLDPADLQPPTQPSQSRPHTEGCCSR